MPTYAPRLAFIGPINTFTGYGLHACQIIRDIERITGSYVSVRPSAVSEAFGATVPVDVSSRIVRGSQPEEWELLLHPPSFLPTPNKKTAYFTMWESTKLPPGAVNLLNRAEAVIVPCQWNASCFSACGVTKPIHVVPLGINADIFKFRGFDANPYCVFGTAGRMAHGGVRKGINAVIDVFQRAFPDETDVELHVKCFPDCPVDKPKDKRIYIKQAHLSESELADWFQALTCFVSGAKSEGWGLMQHQAMAMGRPVITVGYGGVMEFVRPDTAYIVPHTLTPATGTYAGCGHWAEPDEYQMINLMRYVYKNRMEAHERGIRAMESVQHLSWDNANRKLVDVLHTIGAL